MIFTDFLNAKNFEKEFLSKQVKTDYKKLAIELLDLKYLCTIDKSNKQLKQEYNTVLTKFNAVTSLLKTLKVDTNKIFNDVKKSYGILKKEI